jgi:hypothetical protein
MRVPNNLKVTVDIILLSSGTLELMLVQSIKVSLSKFRKHPKSYLVGSATASVIDPKVLIGE